MILGGRLSQFECYRYGRTMSEAGLFAARITGYLQIAENNKVSMDRRILRLADASGGEAVSY